jgi:hypothetical protein
VLSKAGGSFIRFLSVSERAKLTPISAAIRSKFVETDFFLSTFLTSEFFGENLSSKKFNDSTTKSNTIKTKNTTNNSNTKLCLSEDNPTLDAVQDWTESWNTEGPWAVGDGYEDAWLVKAGAGLGNVGSFFAPALLSGGTSLAASALGTAGRVGKGLDLVSKGLQAQKFGIPAVPKAEAARLVPPDNNAGAKKEPTLPKPAPAFTSHASS